MSEEQTQQTGEGASKPKKTRSPKTSTVKNSEIRDMFDTVLASNGELKDVQDRLTAALLEAMDKIDNMSVSNEVLANKIDEIQTESVVFPEDETPNGTAAEPHETIPEGELKDYITTREMFDKYAKQLARRDGELANKKLFNLMEKMCIMRDDYAKLCGDIDKSIDRFSARDVLRSFEAYLVDLENMLTDAGISVGPYGRDGDQVDVAHQRIVGVVPTSDPSKNGTVAKRLSDGYEYEGRPLLKEKVNVYKTSEPAPAKTQTGFRMAP